MSMLRRIRLEIAGIVQGVGFRPYLYRLAQRHALCGWVRNTPSGVELELEGPTEALSSFQDELARSTPPSGRCGTGSHRTSGWAGGLRPFYHPKQRRGGRRHPGFAGYRSLRRLPAGVGGPG